MAAKNPFTPAQYQLIHDALMKAKKKFKNQVQFALALGITQPSLSTLMQRKWKPGVTTAQAIALANGMTLEELVGPLSSEAEKEKESAANLDDVFGRFPNLQVCIRFYATKKQWAPWTIAAARSGFFGERDMAPPDWHDKLDELESVLEAARRRPRIVK